AWHQDNGIYVDRIPRGAPQDIRGGLPVYSTLGMEMADNVSCRISLDVAGDSTGGLYVLPGSHRENYGGNDKVKERFGAERGVLAHQEPGSALCYRPLLLHRAEKMVEAGRRRILHLQYGPDDLRLPGTETYCWPQPRPLSPVDRLA
ncbi:MAG: phytanoyl-CoA dioxygenase family protein, partial [Candidatus Latescibacterota bacterium]|nr:phytanoyl-CoA dioxygenase family protein [Candidatus Latescibacterota bacterium]